MSETASSKRSTHKRRAAGSTSHSYNFNSILITLSVSVVSFYAGTIWTMRAGMDSCDSSMFTNPHKLDANVEQLAQARLLELQRGMPTPDCQSSSASAAQFPETTRKYAVGMVRTKKEEFTTMLDLGVPLDLPQDGAEDVLILYSRDAAQPKHIPKSDDGSIPLLSMQESVAGCDYVNVILTDKSASRNQCIAIVPQYESYHIQKWMRVPKMLDGKHNGPLDSAAPLRLVSRGMQSNGRDQFEPPESKHIKQNWELLEKYMSGFEESLASLKPLVEKVANEDNTVTVMVANFGQSELLVNFVCAARSRNLDTSSILVFATDNDTKELAEQLGLTAFFDERNFGEMPAEAAGRYGDKKFTAMMMAKVICVQMVSALKYNLLFQDVDIVWYKNPLDYFKNTKDDFDVYFQDDGGHTVRYAPYSANSGFYFVRYNARTQYFLTSLLQAGDLILKTDSHQQALIALLVEHVSLYGLRAKVLSRDTDEFPGGYHYHQATGKYMRALNAGEVDPYIFHMSWTMNKDNKLLFFKQMGEWYVQEQCIHKKVDEIPGFIKSDTASSFVSTCCSAEPLISCHYRDKPSKIPCRDSPPIDKGKKSWW